MFNILLDALPEDYEGYPINTAFQTGILISMCLSDEELSEHERILTALTLLYGDNIPPMETALAGLKWFMSETNHDNYEGVKSDNIIIMDYDVDQYRIYAAFRNQYHIDLNTADMHWFEFNGLLDNIRECSLTDVMQLRQTKIPSHFSAKERRELEAKQKIFRLGKKNVDEEYSESEKQRINNFLQYANIKNQSHAAP